MEPIIHILLPLLILLAFIKKYRREAVILSFFSWAMDLDYFIPDYHRIIFHNIFFAIIITVIIYLSLGKIESLITLYYSLSHLILDFDKIGPALFWPFYNYLVTFHITLSKSLYGMFNFNFEIVTSPLTAVSSNIASIWLSNPGTVFLLLTLSAIITGYLIKK